MPVNPSTITDPIILRLNTLAQGSSDLKDAALMYGAILPVLRDADLGTGPVSLTPDQARKKMEEGRPLLSDLTLDLDVDAVRELIIELVRTVESAAKGSRPEKFEAARLIRLALEGNKLDIGALLPHIAANERAPVASTAQNLLLDPGLVWTLVQNALKPPLRAWCPGTKVSASYVGLRLRWQSCRVTIRPNICVAGNAARIGSSACCTACTAETTTIKRKGISILRAEAKSRG
jgi:hypothetical protein